MPRRPSGASITLSVSNNIISNSLHDGIGAEGSATKVWREREYGVRQ
jgi:hypothetical protein